MEKEKIDLFIMQNAKKLPPEQLPFIREKLALYQGDETLLVYGIDLMDPMMLLLVSIFVGGLGIDRFMIGDIGMGVLKLLTGGLFGILWIYDIVTISEKVREKNFLKLMTFLS
ncbi:MAG TPA: TM2 domain-containing protein [Bacilli bacterium]|nr:TM2 domain-containing protein [Bacilli bacterium]